MRLSPALNNYPSGTRPVAAASAGVQFATGPIHGMRVTVRDCLPALTMQNGTDTGSVAFTVRGWSWLGHAEHCKAGHGAVWRNVTPRNGDNFSGLDSTCPGWARHCSAGRGNNATRGDIAGNFQGMERPGWVWQCEPRLGNNASSARYPSAISRGPSGRCKPGNGRARRGSARHCYTLPRAESGTISQGKPGHGLARLGDARRGPARLYVTGDGNPGHFPKHQEAPASRGATVGGMTGSV